MSTVLYIRTNPCETTKTEITVNGVIVADLSVKALKQAVQVKLGVAVDTQCLVFGGRVLKQDKNLGYYKVTDKSTIYLLPKATPPEQGEIAIVPPVQSPAITEAQVMLTRLLRDPQLIRSIVQGNPRLTTDPVFRQLLENPNSILSDPDIINSYLEEHPNVVSILNAMRTRENGSQHEEAENMDYSDGMETPAHANAQEEMYQHSQALLAHQNSVHEQGADAAMDSSQRNHHQQAGAEPHPGLTQGDLATALASVAGTVGDQVVPTSRVEPIQATSGSETRPSQEVGTLSVQAGVINTAQPSNAPTYTSPQVSQFISARALRRALASAVPSSLPSTQLDAAQRASLSNTTSPSPQNVGPQSRMTSSERYRIQLNRLHSMGLTDDAASLHVLEAVNGDLDTAVEILLGGSGH